MTLDPRTEMLILMPPVYARGLCVTPSQIARWKRDAEAYTNRMAELKSLIPNHNPPLCLKPAFDRSALVLLRKRLALHGVKPSKDRQ